MQGEKHIRFPEEQLKRCQLIARLTEANAETKEHEIPWINQSVISIIILILPFENEDSVFLENLQAF